MKRMYKPKKENEDKLANLIEKLEKKGIFKEDKIDEHSDKHSGS